MANPFLVLGGIAVGIITAAFGVLAVPGWVASAQDASVANDIAQVGIAQAAHLSANGKAATSVTGLNGAGVQVTLGTDRVNVAADSTGKHWLAVARSDSGRYFARESDRARIGEGDTVEAAVTNSGATVTGTGSNLVTARGIGLPKPWAMEEVVARNLFMDPSFEGPALPGVNRVTVAHNTGWAAGGSRSVAATRTADASNDAYVELMPHLAGGISSLKPNTRYTFMGTYNLSAPFDSVPVGSSDSALLGQKLSIFAHLGGTTVLTQTGVNTAGVRTLVGTFTTPASFSGYNTIRLYAGDNPNTPNRIRWDKVGLFEGEKTASEWISADSAAPAGTRVAWEGAPYQSATVQYR
ncbi:hypothetical protein [Microbacterium sp. 77mftsu3.1]|uniref:hypothetical protein n=1 Tax=Microbacterium sp. 77mftsu3.1 TaxID=1761802 RepID=UPI00035E4233|nr:hypothetical protein [Microbacterium sp. 77mftsu3.1]SDH49577.1 hypothetical protein SAMN04488590_3442 [Microbacterium sp. 77mftsu3.1]